MTKKTGIVLSASQIKTAELCRRKRHFKNKMKLPEPMKGAQGFGTILHSVLERYLKADSLSRQEDGKPVDLFPEGWAEIKDRRGVVAGELSQAEQQLIRVLVGQALSEGFVERQPGGRVEEEFWMHLEDGVQLMGYVDYITPTRVEDHKTSKSRRYLLSKAKLEDDIQMMVYAAWLMTNARQRGEEPPEWIELAHNQFIKGKDDHWGQEDPGVRKTLTRVRPDSVIEFWNDRIKPLIDQIVEDHRSIEDPFEIPDPEPGACSAYGGCPYLGICNKEESIEHYRKRLANRERNADTSSGSDPETVEDDMSLSDLLAKKRAEKAPPAGESSNPNPKPHGTPVAEAESSAPKAPTPPWYVDGCRACSSSKTPGFNSNGNPCAICASNSRKAGGPSPENYDISLDAQGNRTWAPKEGSEGSSGEQPAPTPAPAEDRQQKTVMEVTKKPPQPAPEPEDSTPGMDEEEETREADLELPKGPAPAPTSTASEIPGDLEMKRRGPGRPKKGPSLLVRCAPIRSGKITSTTIDEVLSNLVIDGKPYFQVEVWTRRDWVKANVEMIVDQLKGYVIQHVSDPDQDNLVSAMVPYCEIVIRGTF